MTTLYLQEQITTHLTPEAAREELARQNDELAQAARRLATLGTGALAVPRPMLAAIDEACLVRTSTLARAAIRG